MKLRQFEWVQAMDYSKGLYIHVTPIIEVVCGFAREVLGLVKFSILPSSVS